MISTAQIHEWNWDVLPTRLVTAPLHSLSAWIIRQDTEYECIYVGEGVFAVDREGFDGDEPLVQQVGRLAGILSVTPVLWWFIVLFWVWTWFVTASTPATTTTAGVLTAASGVGLYAAVGDIGAVEVTTLDGQGAADGDT